MLRYVLTSELFPSVYLCLNDPLINVTFRRAIFVCFCFWVLLFLFGRGRAFSVLLP